MRGNGGAVVGAMRRVELVERRAAHERSLVAGKTVDLADVGGEIGGDAVRLHDATALLQSRQLTTPATTRFTIPFGKTWLHLVVIDVCAIRSTSCHAPPERSDTVLGWTGRRWIVPALSGVSVAMTLRRRGRRGAGAVFVVAFTRVTVATVTDSVKETKVRARSGSALGTQALLQLRGGSDEQRSRADAKYLCEPGDHLERHAGASSFDVLPMFHPNTGALRSLFLRERKMISSATNVGGK